jgi:hypothetical protein
MSRKKDAGESEAWIGSATMEEDGTIVLRLRAGPRTSNHW